MKEKRMSPLEFQQKNEELYMSMEITYCLDNYPIKPNVERLLKKLRNRLSIKTKPSFLDDYL